MGTARLTAGALLIAVATVGAVCDAAAASSSGSAQQASALIAQASPATDPTPSTSTTPGAVGPSGSALPSVTEPPTEQQRRLVVQERRCLGTLEPIDRRVLSLRYGLRGRNPAGLDAVAKRLGFSIAHVQRIERRALTRLRRATAAGPRCGVPAPVAATPSRSTASRGASSKATTSKSSSRHYVGLIFLIMGLSGLAGVLVYIMRELRRSL